MPVCANCGHANREGARFCEECGSRLTAGPSPGRQQRKTVTVLFCDLTGSTALGERLDPERLRAVLARYFERMKGIAERYGGRVEEFIGDAVMAVFGVPVVHEDDALRALRSAIEMRDALPELGLEGRIGVMTGEVVTGTEAWLAGDAVNVAARLEQAAQPGEVLLGEPTLVLVRDAVEVKLVDALELKGKAAPVPAYRLLRVLEAPERQYETPFVGRQRELGILRSAWERAQAGKHCEPSSSWRATSPQQQSLDRRLAECSTSWGKNRFSRPQPGDWRRRFTSSTGSTRPARWASRAAELGASEDAMTQMLVRQVRAKVLALRGEREVPRPLAREAVAIGEGTDMLNYQADAHADLGEVLLLTAKPDEAVAALELERYERKGVLASTRRTRTRLAEIRSEAPASQT